jgi:hypothetical protein
LEVWVFVGLHVYVCYRVCNSCWMASMPAV